MEQALNTLFVMTQSAYVHLDHETVQVEVDREVKLQVPLHHLGGITVFGNVLVSPGLLAKCAEDGRSVSWLSASGRFVGRMEGPVSGNVLLRKAQYAIADNQLQSLAIARPIIAAKVSNYRSLLQRHQRNHPENCPDSVATGATIMGNRLIDIQQSMSLDELRGYEGDARIPATKLYDLNARATRTHPGGEVTW